MQKFIFFLVIAAAYYVRYQYFKEISKACAVERNMIGKERTKEQKRECAWSITMLMNITNLFILVVPFLFSSSCNQMVVTIGLALFLTTQLSYLEMIYF